MEAPGKTISEGGDVERQPGTGGEQDMTTMEKTEWQQAVELVTRSLERLRGPKPIYKFIDQISERRRDGIEGSLALDVTLHLIDNGSLEYNPSTYEIGPLKHSK